MKRNWGIFWAIAAFGGIAALIGTVRIPSESRSAFLFGLSKSKLALCAGIICLALFCATAAAASFKSEKGCRRLRSAGGIAAYVLMSTLVVGKILLSPPVGRTAFERALSERLTPLAYWGAGFILLYFLFSLPHVLRRYRFRAVDLIIPLSFLVMGGAMLFALHTGIGLTPISGTFYRQGVSLLEGHLVVPLLVLLPLLPLYLLLRKSCGKYVTPLVPVLVWAAAVYFWQTTAFEGRSYFVPALRAPNYNFYPASDAENYDLLAQSILIGNGFRNGLTVVRPLYAAFLALLHTFFGNDYMRVTNAQIMVLALIPAFVYLIGCELKHPCGGLLAAAWVILREIYSIRVTPLVQVSNSRLFMSDLPTALLICLVIYCGLKWLRSPRKTLWSLLSGGAVGTAMLLRTQCLVLIPALWLFILCSGKPFRKALKHILLSFAGMALVFVPWTLYGIAFPNTTVNADVSESQYLVKLYRTAVDETDPGIGLPELILAHPVEVVQAVGAHFLNNEISSLLVLPVRDEPAAEAEALFYDDSLFWYRENASATIRGHKPLIALYLLVIGIGIASAVRRVGRAGWYPLLVHVCYNAGNAFALNSGFRFILPVDWVLMFYFAFGCECLLTGLCGIFLNLNGTDKTEEKLPERRTKLLPAAVLLFAVGLILPFCDCCIPYRYSDDTEDELMTEWLALSPNAESILAEYTEEDGLVLLKGRAIYPRFYKAGEGDSGGSSSAKRGLDDDRMVWMLVNRGVFVLNQTLKPASDVEMPVTDPMDVIAAGIVMDDYIEVLDMTELR